jgi:subtilisin family serine protease
MMGAQSLHQNRLDGRGISIAVLDSGFNGYRNELGRALPRGVTVKSFRVDGNLEAKSSLHGLTCAEIVHSVAPGAELLLANWEPDSPKHFLQAVRWAKEQGAKVISCSIVMPGWSDGVGGGEVHRQLREILGDPSDPQTPIFVSAVGNLAERHHRANYRDDGNGWHRFNKRSELKVTPWGSNPVCIELTHSGEAQYRLHVYDGNGREVGTRFGPAAEGVHGHSVRFFPDSMEDYSLRVEKIRGNVETPFRIMVLSADLEESQARGSLSFPADGDRILAVGAVDEREKRISYSGCGGENTKPACVAMVPFPTTVQPAFSGTSAAAPQVAGLIGLLWSSEPKAASGTIRERLLKNCKDLGPNGLDWETGHGLIRAPR